MKSIKVQIQELTVAIEAMQSQGRATDFLEDTLRNLLAKAPQLNNLNDKLFEIGAPITEPVISRRELAQMHVFGYVVDGNSLADKRKLRTTQAYQIGRKHGHYIGF